MKRSKKNLLIPILNFSFIFFLLIQQGWAEGEVKLTARLEQDRIPLNREARLIVEARWQGKPGQFTLLPIESPNVTHLKITSTATANRIETKNQEIITVRRYEFSLQPETLGMAYIDEIQLQYKDANGEEYSLQTPRLQLEVVDPLPEPRKNLIGPITGFGILAVVLLAGLVLFWNGRVKQKQAALLAKEEERTLEEIFAAKLREEVSLQSDELAEQYAALSSLLRKYLQQAFPLQENTGTTEELLKNLDEFDIPMEQRTPIQEVLQTCDVVKFSGAAADPNQLARLFTLTEELFRKRKPNSVSESEGENNHEPRSDME